MRISRILHAGYLFESNGARIVFDPIFENPFSRNCYAFPSVRFDLEAIASLEFTAVFLSHHHDDHFSLESLRFLERKTPIYFYCMHEELFGLIRALGFEDVRPLALNTPVRIGGFEIIPRRALDPDVDTLFHIQAEGLHVLNVVDSWIDPMALDELRTHAPWDLVLWPFQTMREIDVLSPSRASPASMELPPEWLEQIAMLRPKAIVPSSCQFIHEPWSWYNHAMFPITYRQFEREVSALLPETKVLRMEPSCSITLANQGIQLDRPLEWVIPVGESNVDYDFREDLTIPDSASVARNFEALNPAEAARVRLFCDREVLVRYRGLPSSSEPYFETEQIWCLIVYDHLGNGEVYHYRLSGHEIERVGDVGIEVSWTTEVSAARLYGALEWGESLTSMYVRVNDGIFAPEIEKDLRDVDILEDPLIRCLFTGVVGGFQKAQLKRLSGAVEESEA